MGIHLHSWYGWKFQPGIPVEPGCYFRQPVLFALYMGWFQPTKPVEPARNNSFLDAPGGLGSARVLLHNPVTYIVVGPFKRKGSENVDLSRLGNPLLSRFPNRERQSGTKRGALLSRVWQPGQKSTFCPGW